MLDFVTISTKTIKKDVIEIYPEFKVIHSEDLMVRGKAFYGIWIESEQTWSRDENDVARIVDEMIFDARRELKKTLPETVSIKLSLMRNFSSRKWTEWQSYVKSLPDNYHELDNKIIFSNTEVKKTDYVSRKLPYEIAEGSTANYNELIGTLYTPSERDKLEWAIGAIISGDSRNIQKFIVLYGESGSGKSTFLNIVKDMFDGYCADFKAKDLGMSNSEFALEAFKNNPLIAIEHDGDLSRIEDNTRLNSLVSHESMLVNEKFKSKYSMRFDSFLFMGTNKPVKITEAKSGIIRRLIDVTPSGHTIEPERYEQLVDSVKFEHGAIAYHCLKKYEKMGPRYYNRYKPNTMISATNDFFNFIEDNYDIFSDDDGITLDAAWTEYKKYIADANLTYSFTRRVFKEELKNYYREFKERYKGRYKLYLGFRKEKFDYISSGPDDAASGSGSVDEAGAADSDSGSGSGEVISESDVSEIASWLKLDKTVSLLDEIFAECRAQLASDDETPSVKWSNVYTKLRNIDTKKLHYVLVPENLIVIDFDIRDKNGNKDPEANLRAASKWPATYAEYSKSGGGIHLHYYYNGDVLQLSRIYEENIEIKVFKKNDGSRGYSSLRRVLSYCNDIPIATINSGLPLKGAKNVVNFEAVKSERALRTLIIRNLNKEYHGATAPSVDFIFKILEDAYASNLSYDVSDLRPAVLSFAMKSTHQSSKCIDLVAKMHFRSEEASPGNEDYGEGTPIVFFDVEVFPNLLVICWKERGTPREATVSMINPTPDEVKKLFRMKLVGFNNRRYDNHILYAASLGYTNKRIYDISQGIVSNEKMDRSCFFREAYNLSYTDIYDFASKKQSLKKWEIELGIHHQELGLPWDEEVSEDLWGKVADYCVNDVIATEAVFEARHDDFLAREILAGLSGLTVNDTTNSHTTQLIVGEDKHPQDKFVYTDLREMFPGYEFDNTKKDDKSTYMGESVGEGGYVYSEPGMYKNVALLDIASMHPHSAIALNVFGPYTENFKQLVQARLFIKHNEYDKAGALFDGKLSRYLSDSSQADSLAYALKIAINSVYGLTAAKFDNRLRDPRNIDNIVAKRGALFMVNLKHEVQKRGFTVAHVKTDSIKVPDATPEIISYISEYGKKYGYTFEHEATYEKMCLVNDAVYIAKYRGGKHDGEWTATGTQFQVPYVFKTLFSKEPIEHDDVCETKAVVKGLGLYLDMNENLPDVSDLEKERDKLSKELESYPVRDGTERLEDLDNAIAKGHDYMFIGKVGQFCPIKQGCGGGILLRESNGKFYAATGTKKEYYDKAGGEEGVYRWLETEVVDKLNKWDDVDDSYYRVLVDEAVNDISKYGDAEWFMSDDPVPPVPEKPSITLENFMNIPETPEDIDVEEVPFN